MKARVLTTPYCAQMWFSCTTSSWRSQKCKESVLSNRGNLSLPLPFCEADASRYRGTICWINSRLVWERNVHPTFPPLKNKDGTRTFCQGTCRACLSSKICFSWWNGYHPLPFSRGKKSRAGCALYTNNPLQRVKCETVAKADSRWGNAGIQVGFQESFLVDPFQVGFRNPDLGTVEWSARTEMLDMGNTENVRKKKRWRKLTDWHYICFTYLLYCRI